MIWGNGEKFFCISLCKIINRDLQSISFNPLYLPLGKGEDIRRVIDSNFGGDDMRVVLSKSPSLVRREIKEEVLLSMKLTTPNPLLNKEGAA